MKKSGFIKSQICDLQLLLHICSQSRENSLIFVALFALHMLNRCNMHPGHHFREGLFHKYVLLAELPDVGEVRWKQTTTTTTTGRRREMEAVAKIRSDLGLLEKFACPGLETWIRGGSRCCDFGGEPLLVSPKASVRSIGGQSKQDEGSWKPDTVLRGQCSF